MRMLPVSRSLFHSMLNLESILRSTCLATVAFLVMVALLSQAPAQVLYGTLTGTVTDASAAPVPSAKIEAKNTGTGVSKQTTTDDRGNYIFTDLQPGTYTVTISAPS